MTFYWVYLSGTGEYAPNPAALLCYHHQLTVNVCKPPYLVYNDIKFNRAVNI